MSAPSQDIAADILSYFLENPRAVDSLEGIARWRLREVEARRTSNDVNAALNRLVDEGFLREHVTRAAGRNFCLNSERAADAAAVLERMRRKPPSK